MTYWIAIWMDGVLSKSFVRSFVGSFVNLALFFCYRKIGLGCFLFCVLILLILLVILILIVLRSEIKTFNPKVCFNFKIACRYEY